MAVEKTTLKDGQTQITLTGGVGFLMPPLDPATQAVAIEPLLYFEGSLGQIDEFIEESSRIVGNAHLSPLGKEEKLLPIQAERIAGASHAWASIASYEQHLDKREAELLKVPSLDPTYTAMAIEDREMRDWWSRQDLDTRAKLLEKIGNEPGHDRMMIALLRSPVPQLDHEVQFVRDVWNRTRRLDNLPEAHAISSGRAAVEWSRRGVAQAAVILRRVLDQDIAQGTKQSQRWDDERILRNLVTSKDERVQNGIGVFGFNPTSAVQMRHRIAGEQRQRV